MADTIKLYHVYSTLPTLEVKGIKLSNVHVSWFVKGRAEPPAPFEILINDYDASVGHAIHAQNAVVHH